MLSAWKDILLQVLLSGVFTFQIPLLFSRCRTFGPEHGTGEQQHYRNLIVMACAVGILLCFGFSALHQGVIPINLGIVPLFAGILYGSRVSGLLLSLLYISCHQLIFGFSLFGMLMHTGLPVYPLMFLIASRFKRSKVMEKIGWLWTGLLPAMLIIVASPLLESKFGADVKTSETFVMTLLYVLLSIFNGGLLIYLMETVYERLFPDPAEILREQRAVLQQLLDMLPLGISVVDPRGHISMINEQFVKIHKKESPHLGRNDLIGRGLDGMFEGPAPKNGVKGRIHSALRGIRTSGEIIRSAGRVYSTGAFPIFDERTKGIQGAVLIVHDITELEKLRTELINVERLSMVGQMAASITHEIRNPMAVVRGFLQLMKEKSPDTLEHYYRIVMDELDRANGIISDFLSLAQNRISEKEECHLHDIIHELSPLLWADANLRGQSIELKLENHVPVLLLNAKEIKQLILNLCRNGMEAMDDKGQLTIETRMAGDVVELHVQDTGVGIPQDKLDRLFEPFFTTKSKGTGLGLALCLSIVQRHEGNISVHSEEGKGTRFSASFPVPKGLTAENG
ncbi:two-component system sensor histidine kinase NtrB [Paenibacillus sp. DMB20]|uniref:two-component system sensor histidine kinase NtrB n=1 Tax=Paenibacillus sp. DMB20 TaxID=1642570 RepID=UPI0006281D2B|nr:ATP-binding protein [Paenibacillus sp. DMB20]KKO50834.1 histidine kinase [Paenibacillus sp. DMB20]